MEKNEVKKIVLFVTLIASFLAPFMSSSINVALPSIGKELGLDVILLSWVSSAFLLSSAVFLVPLGKIADIFGRKKIFFLGILIYTIFSFLCFISKSGSFLIFSRVFQGIGAAMIFGTSVALLSSVFLPGERGKALGYNSAAVYLGLSLGPSWGGFLTKNFGWQSIFFFNVFLGLILIILVFFKLKAEWAETKKEKFDFVGSFLYSLSLFLIIYGVSLLPKNFGKLLILLGAIGFLFFIKWENKIENPVVNIKLFRSNITFTFSNLAVLLNYSATFGVGFLLSLYLQYIKGFDAQKTGLILISQPIVMTVFSPIAGWLSDKVKPYKIASFGMFLSFISLLIFTFLKENTSLELIIISLIVLGLGLAFFASPNANVIMSSVEKEFYGVASATLATMRLVGQMLSMGISMLILANYLGKIQIIPQYYPIFLQAMRIIFSVFSIFCLFGIFFSLLRKN